MTTFFSFLMLSEPTNRDTCRCSLITGFKVWQNQTHSTSRGGRTRGVVDPTTVRSEINGIHSSSYLKNKNKHRPIRLLWQKEKKSTMSVITYSWPYYYLLIASTTVAFSWSHWDSATAPKNPIFRLAADTRSTPSRIVSASEISEAFRLSDMSYRERESERELHGTVCLV